MYISVRLYLSLCVLSHWICTFVFPISFRRGMQTESWSTMMMSYSRLHPPIRKDRKRARATYRFRRMAHRILPVHRMHMYAYRIYYARMTNKPYTLTIHIPLSHSCVFKWAQAVHFSLFLSPLFLFSHFLSVFRPSLSSSDPAPGILTYHSDGSSLVFFSCSPSSYLY